MLKSEIARRDRWTARGGASSQPRAARVRGSGRPRREPNDATAGHEAPGLAELRPWRVLLVDDEPAIRLICSVNLELSGFQPTVAADGADGLAMARRSSFDLFLLDVMMPGMDGWELAAELAARAETREVPIVFLSARAEAADRRQAYERGAVGYIVKPFDPLQLGETLEKIIRSVRRGERDLLRAALVDGS